MSYRKLIESQQYEHRICGMHQNLAVAIRDKIIRAKSESDQAAGAAKAIKANFENRLAKRDNASNGNSNENDNTNNNRLSFGLIVCSAIRDYQVLSNGHEDVIIYLLSDVTDIDSKQMTFVRNGIDGESIFKSLYKYDATS
eukprot:GEZU01007869.1.p1 GENE.GEZU01007869.1~~GEZU01007869.1.p1  ORF type:complete len:141 (-),score=38.48 GEZU01007869.1:270-692(-)